MLSGSSLSRSTVLISKEKGTSEGVVAQLVLLLVPSEHERVSAYKRRFHCSRTLLWGSALTYLYYMIYSINTVKKRPLFDEVSFCDLSRIML